MRALIPIDTNGRAPLPLESVARTLLRGLPDPVLGGTGIGAPALGATALGAAALGAPGLPATGPDSGIRIDVFDEDESLVVHAEAPGVGREGVELHLLDERHLRIAVRKEQLPVTQDARALHAERVYGELSRTIRLPYPVEASEVRAEVRSGVVVVTLPKAASHRPRRIEVREG